MKIFKIGYAKKIGYAISVLRNPFIGYATKSLCPCLCKKWVHKKCSGVVGSLTRIKEGFTCRKCRGVMPRPSVVGNGETLEMEGERYGVVNSFCYLGDML